MSLCKRVIARLDVKPSIGCCKGIRYEGLRRVGDVGELLTRYTEQGADELLVLDGTASLYGRSPDLDWLTTLPYCYLPMVYGGGIRSVAHVRELYRRWWISGVAVNTAAVERPALITEIAERYGAQAVTLNLEVKRGQAYTHGGRNPSGRDAIEWAMDATARGAGQIVASAVERDGTRLGLDHAFLAALLEAVTVPVVLSGGAADAADVVQAFAGGASGVGIATILHSGEWDIPRIKAAMSEAEVAVRL